MTAGGHHLAGVRLGLPAAGDLAGGELIDRRRVRGHRGDRHVTATGLGGGQAVLLEPVTQGHVLGVAQRRGCQLLALELTGAVDALLHDQVRAARGRPRDHLDQLATGGLEGLDRRVGPDVGRVQLAGQQRGGLLGAGAERGQLQRHALAQVLGEEPFLDGHQGGGMRDVLQVAKPQRHRTRGTRPPRRSTAAARRPARGRQQGDTGSSRCNERSPHRPPSRSV